MARAQWLAWLLAVAGPPPGRPPRSGSWTTGPSNRAIRDGPVGDSYRIASAIGRACSSNWRRAARQGHSRSRFDIDAYQATARAKRALSPPQENAFM